jgi:hypothetical protein
VEGVDNYFVDNGDLLDPIALTQYDSFVQPEAGVIPSDLGNFLEIPDISVSPDLSFNTPPLSIDQVSVINYSVADSQIRMWVPKSIRGRKPVRSPPA